MTFYEAISKCYRKYFNFKGRAGKKEFWSFVLLIILFAWPLLLTELKNGTWYHILNIFYFVLTVTAIIPLMAAFTRRMHDVGKSGWVWTFIFIPIIGFFLLLRWTTKVGKPEPNQYGEPDNIGVYEMLKKELNQAQ